MASQGVPWVWGLALLSLLSVGSALAADSSRNSLVDRVRAANDRFKDVKVAVAKVTRRPLRVRHRWRRDGYGLGPFYELHVWAWKTNPRGGFADMNPNVTCEHAHGK
jgi:hypothetical protein